MNTDRKKALMHVQTLGFALDEAVLFLDTHPDNKEALEYFHEMHEKYDAAVAAYVSNYGPLQFTDVKHSDGWSWGRDCLPWEGECNVEI